MSVKVGFALGSHAPRISGHMRSAIGLSPDKEVSGRLSLQAFEINGPGEIEMADTAGKICLLIVTSLRTIMFNHDVRTHGNRNTGR